MNSTREIKVWDPLVRLFHWSAVVTFAICYITQEQEYMTHLVAGYLLLGVTLIRIIWGFTGPVYARFSDFVCSPSTVFRHLRNLLSGRPRHYVGHNPAGGAMIVMLLLGIMVITLSGIALDGAENRSGPLGGSTLFRHLSDIQDIHDYSTDITVVLIAIHLLGVTAQSLLTGENLVRAMITGKKTSR